MTERKPAPPKKADDPEQSKRFIDMAQEVEATGNPATFDKVFNKVSEMPKSTPPKPNKRLPNSTR